MWFIKEIKLLAMDFFHKRAYLFLWLLLLLFCTLYLVKIAVPIKGDMGFPQFFDYFFSNFTFVFPVLPLFLFFLAFVLIPFFEPLRFIRYIKKERIFASLLLRIFLTVFLFTALYLGCGFILGGLYSGQWENIWITKNGLPYLTYGEQLQLNDYFNTYWMITRYFLTSLLLFNMLGILFALFYILIPRYTYSFIIVCTITILDNTLQKMHGISFINQPLSLGLTEWLMPETFQTTLFMFGGMCIIFTALLYIAIEKKDYFNTTTADNGKNN